MTGDPKCIAALQQRRILGVSLSGERWLGGSRLLLLFLQCLEAL